MIGLTVNGTVHESAADPDTPLLYALRNELGLTGARFGCGLGLCGACFVHVDGAVVASCDTPLWSVEGRTVVTIEGLAPGDELHAVQQAVLDQQAAQCAYCLTGVVMSGAALLEHSPHPDRAPSSALPSSWCRGSCCARGSPAADRTRAACAGWRRRCCGSDSAGQERVLGTPAAVLSRPDVQLRRAQAAALSLIGGARSPLRAAISDRRAPDGMRAPRVATGE